MSALVTHFQTMARYNRIANERLYAACAELADADRKMNRGAFFDSIHGTLNHILVGDRIWFGRFENVPVSLRLDAELYADFGELRAARVAEDARIERFAATLDEARLTAPFEWVNTKGQPNRRAQLSPVMAHVFNHQTHHRGQVHGLLSQAGVEPPVLDLVYLIQD